MTRTHNVAVDLDEFVGAIAQEERDIFNMIGFAFGSDNTTCRVCG